MREMSRRCKRRSVVGVEDHGVLRSPGAAGCDEGVGNEAGAQMVGGGPADDTAGGDVGDSGQVEPPLLGGDAGDVAAPSQVGAGRIRWEVA